MKIEQPNPTPINDEEIDLIELAITLWQEKWLIILTTLLGVAIAVGYALMATPVYQSQSEVVPPYSAQLVELNKGLPQRYTQGDALVSEKGAEDFYSLSSIDGKEGYQVYTNILRSQSLKTYFAETYYLPILKKEEQGDISPRRLQEKFNEKLKITRPDGKNDPDRYRISVTDEDPEITVAWANDYPKIAEEWAKEQLLEDREAEIAVLIDSLTLQIDYQRQALELEAQDELERLKEALTVAQAVNIKNPLKSAKDDENNQDGTDNPNITFLLSNELLYLQGEKALISQIKNLESRDLDKVLPKELRALLAQKELFEQLTYKADKITLHNIDSVAELPDNPIKPKKKLIVIVGVLIGGMLGGIIALLRIAVRSRREITRL